MYTTVPEFSVKGNLLKEKHIKIITVNGYKRKNTILLVLCNELIYPSQKSNKILTNITLD